MTGFCYFINDMLESLYTVTISAHNQHFFLIHDDELGKKCKMLRQRNKIQNI